MAALPAVDTTTFSSLMNETPSENTTMSGTTSVPMSTTAAPESVGLSVQEQVDAIKANIDVFFLIINSIVIYFMQCGFAFLECGAVRSKNTTNILMKNVLDSFISGLSYWIIGYAVAFGDGNQFMGYTKWVSTDISGTEFATWFFHFVFAATAATIVSGALAERCEFVAYLVYSTVLTGFMYPIVTHWAWSGNGWMTHGPIYEDALPDANGDTTYSELSFQDFAGSGVVHLLGGTAAFVGAALMGPRINRFDIKKRPVEIRGHSVPLAAMGGFILFFGFFAFNGGSQASISQPGDGAAIALAVTNTILSGSAAAFTALLGHRIILFVQEGEIKWSLLASINGALTGMVAICAGCNTVYPWGAVVIGFLAGLAYMGWARLVLWMVVDDPLEAVAVHGGGGLLGIIMAPILKRDTGIVFTWSRRSGLDLAWNLAGAAAIFGWTAALCLIMFGFLKLIKMLRVNMDVEINGLDIYKHGEPAYPVEAYGHGWEGERGYVEHRAVEKRSRTGSIAGIFHVPVGPQYENPEAMNRHPEGLPARYRGKRKFSLLFTKDDPDDLDIGKVKPKLFAGAEDFKQGNAKPALFTVTEDTDGSEEGESNGVVVVDAGNLHEGENIEMDMKL